jgi:dolichol-phosphate mannosyltransferase
MEGIASRNIAGKLFRLQEKTPGKEARLKLSQTGIFGTFPLIKMATIDYSIVIPVYYNEGCLIGLMRSLAATVLARNSHYRGEIIFVDDGSEDESLAELLDIQKEFPDVVTIIKLTRNFGQGAAAAAGYQQAKGKCVVTMSADGQDPPEMINEMLRAFFNEAYEIVICTRARREESIYRKLTSKIYFYLMRKLTFENMPKGGFDFFLMSWRAKQVFLRNFDMHSSGQGQILWMGLKTKLLPYHRRARLAGLSRWTFAKKFTSFLDGILSDSSTPIRIISLAGCVFSLLGFAYAGAILIGKLFFNNPTPAKGWAPLMIMILIMGGFQMIMLGLIGEYLWRTLAQARRRDMYLIDAVYEPNDSAELNESGRPPPGKELSTFALATDKKE